MADHNHIEVERRSIPPLSDEQMLLLPEMLDSFRNDKIKAEAMSALAIKVRRILTLLLILVAAFTMGIEQLKAFAKFLVRS